MRTRHQTLIGIAGIALTCVARPDLGAQPRQNCSSYPTLDSITLKHAVIEAITSHYFNKVVLDTTLSAQEIANTLDPFSHFVSEEQYRESMTDFNDEAFRFGFEFRIAAKRVVISSVVGESPAGHAGLLPGDELRAISNVVIPPDYDAIARIFREGDQVVLDIYRTSEHKSYKLSLHRANCPETSVPSAGLIDSITGYIQVSGFHIGTARLVRQKVDILREHGMKALVIDLRGNPGGLVNECLAMANLFIHTDYPVLSYLPDNWPWDTLSLQALYPNLPLAILVDQESCSGSELFTGIMQDLDRAVVIGQPTVGKGMVMNYVPLPNGDKLYLTVREYLLPSGRCVQRPYAGRRFVGEAYRFVGNCDNFDHQVDSQLAEAGCSVYRTKAGTRVIGGEGIIPDVIVSERTYPTWFRQAIYEAALPMLEENAAWLLTTRLDNFERYEVPKEAVMRAIQYCEAHDTSENKIVTAQVANEIPTFIKWYLAYSIWDDQGTFAIWTKHIAHVRLAQRLLYDRIQRATSGLATLSH